MQDNESALAYAVRYGYADIARLLLENVATMDFEDKVRRTSIRLFSKYS